MRTLKAGLQGRTNWDDLLVVLRHSKGAIMPPYFYQEVNMTEKKARARTKKGHYVADDPSTPDVNEAYVQETPKKAAAPKIVWFESRQPEASMFDVAGLRSIRRYSDNHLEWKVMSDDVARFEKDHFIMNGRVRRKAVE
jgi:hypothetical protein